MQSNVSYMRQTNYNAMCKIIQMMKRTATFNRQCVQ